MKGRLLVFMDESGDPTIGKKIDPQYPVFGVAAVLMSPEEYRDAVLAMADFKLRYFGHEGAVLHSREITKRIGAFDVLNDPSIRKPFLDDISALIRNIPFQLVVAVLDKRIAAHVSPHEVVLHRILDDIESRAVETGCSFVQYVAESIGSVEDAAVRRAFTAWRDLKPREIRHWLEFTRKDMNVVGVQLADLLVTPCTRQVLDGVEHPSMKAFADKIVGQISVLS
jgi:hypothetical protein